ncbi:MAG: phosphate ABC transporter ATP-binding protein [Spirochaetales bacterium]|nr:phosphate ABC transporter ATP-binding protein [Spirochaetales bacterium]
MEQENGTKTDFRLHTLHVKKADETDISDGNGRKAEQSTYKIQTQSLNLFYGDKQALVDVTMDVAPNKVTALIGPSGCGKSTFLRTLNRMNDLISSVRIEGTVLYDNTDIYRDFNVIELRKRIGMVFQKPNPFPMSVYDNVAYGPRVHGIRKKSRLDDIVERSIRRAALWDEVDGRLDESGLGLSGGQQQRLCIARVLAVEPDVILMDEPTSALDPISTAKIEDLIETLKRNYTIIIVTHNMQQAGRISDVTAFFLNGVMIEMGKARDIFFNPKDKRTEDYICGRFG